MGPSYYTNPVIFLIETITGLYILAVMLRFLLQWVDAEYYNPISQFLVKITHPPLKILRRFIPSIGRIDSASVVFLFALQMLTGLAIFMTQNIAVPVAALFFWALTKLIGLIINIFFYAILIRALLSWIAPDIYNPVTAILAGLTEPFLRAGRRIIPPISGIDLSPLVILVGLHLTQLMLLPPLDNITRSFM